MRDNHNGWAAGHAACVVYLLKRHANPGSTNKQGKTAMDLAKSEEVRAALQAAAEEAAAATAASATEQAQQPAAAAAAAPAQPATANVLPADIGPKTAPDQQPGPASEAVLAAQPEAKPEVGQGNEAGPPAATRKRPAETQDHVVAPASEPDAAFNPHKRVAQDLYQDED